MSSSINNTTDKETLHWGAFFCCLPLNLKKLETRFKSLKRSTCEYQSGSSLWSRWLILWKPLLNTNLALDKMYDNLIMVRELLRRVPKAERVFLAWNNWSVGSSRCVLAIHGALGQGRCRVVTHVSEGWDPPAPRYRVASAGRRDGCSPGWLRAAWSPEPALQLWLSRGAERGRGPARRPAGKRCGRAAWGAGSCPGGNSPASSNRAPYYLSFR